MYKRIKVSKAQKNNTYNTTPTPIPIPTTTTNFNPSILQSFNLSILPNNTNNLIILILTLKFIKVSKTQNNTTHNTTHNPTIYLNLSY